jgi:iron complex transport system ATP-binding protein
MIEATDVKVSLGGKQVLHGVDFVAPTGAVAVIVGPNGSGKSTFLKAVSGELAYTGRISIHGQEVAAMKPAAAAAVRAVLPQSTVLSFPFTVREVVRLGLTHGRSGAPPRELDRLPERALARVDLEGFGGRFYQELSGGEQQRVQLARVLCQVWAPVIEGRRRYLLVDEPVSSLDIRHQLQIMEIARDFARRGGGVVAILHDLNLTAMVADTVCVLAGGRVVASGSPREVFTDAVLVAAFGCALRVGDVPADGTPFVLPQSAMVARAAG